MNRLAMIAATCVLGLVLSACGDNNAPKPEAGKTDVPATTTPDKTDATVKTDGEQSH